MDTAHHSQRYQYLPAVIEDIARRLIQQRQEANDHIRRVLDCSTTVGCTCEFCTPSDEEYVEDEEEDFGEDPMFIEGGDSSREDGGGQMEEETEEVQEDEEEFEYENP